MSDWPTIEGLVKQRDDWIEEFGIHWEGGQGVYYHEEISQSDHLKLEELGKKNLVWTHHGTCQNEMITSEYLVFEGTGCGCYQSRTYYVAEKPHDGNSDYSIEVTAFLPCTVCNPDGEGQGEEECEGPKLPETSYGVDMSDCEEGWVQFYLD